MVVNWAIWKDLLLLLIYCSVIDLNFVNQEGNWSYVDLNRSIFLTISQRF